MDQPGEIVIIPEDVPSGKLYRLLCRFE